MSNTIERVRQIMYRDDACEVGNLVPSDLRELVGEIDRLRNLVDSESIRELLGHIEDHGDAKTWALAAAWMQERDDTLATPALPSDRSET